MRRYLADPPIAQTFNAILLVAHAQPSEAPTRHPQKLASFLPSQATALILLKRILKRLTKTSHNTVVRRIAALQNRRRTWRTTHALQKADK